MSEFFTRFFRRRTQAPLLRPPVEPTNVTPVQATPPPEKQVVKAPAPRPQPLIEVDRDLLQTALQTVAAVPVSQDRAALNRMLARLRGPDCYEVTARELGYYPSGSRPFYIRDLP